MTLRGVSHVHSKYSFDGKLALQEVQQFFEGHGFDFVLMSEHIEEMQLDDMQRFIDDCRRFSRPECLLIPGIEMDELHILNFGVKEVAATASVFELAKAFHGQGALVVLSHPIKIRKGIPPGIEPMLSGVEVWNCRYDGKLAPRLSNLTLFRDLRARNARLVATCGIDFHSTSDYAPVWMEVDVNDRSEEQILEAIRRGHARVTRKGRPVPTAMTEIGWRDKMSHFKNHAYTSVYDSVRRKYSWLASRGIRPPAGLRRALKRFF